MGFKVVYSFQLRVVSTNNFDTKKILILFCSLMKYYRFIKYLAQT